MDNQQKIIEILRDYTQYNMKYWWYSPAYCENHTKLLWEGIGISSYLLINFWFTRIQANKSAIKALTVNRVGDMFLTIGFFALIWVFGTVDYATIFSLSPYINETSLTIIGLLFLLAAMGKSAQLGLHTWLPDAMEGPTPVSALIHAATLVTAGVYLLLRSSPLLEYAPTALLAVTWVGALTAFFAATTGLLQNDLKRVIAFSTCSQMGYLFMAVGLSQYDVAIFHLVNHAFFKALLFLAAGGVLHSMADQQDLRRLGGLVTLLPFTYTAMTIGSLSLMALPWLSGFYSKDKILEFAYGQFEWSGHLVYWLGTITAGLTAFYSYRLVSLTFFGTPNAPRGDYEHLHEQSLIVAIPYVILSILSIFFGYIASDLFVGPGSDMLSTALFMHPDHVSLVDGEFGLPLLIKNLPAILSISGAGLAVLMYHKFPYVLTNMTETSVGLAMYRFFNAKWTFDILYNKYIIEPTLALGLLTSKILDRGVIELIGPYGLSQSLYSASTRLASADTGSISSYGLFIFVGAISLTLLLFAPALSGIETWPASLGDMRLVLIYGSALFYIAMPSDSPRSGTEETSVAVH